MARLKDDYRSLTGPQKAGMFMMSIGSAQAGTLFERMDDEEIRELSTAMSSLGSMSSNMVERLFVEFADQLSSAGGLVGSYTTTEHLLAGALDEERVSTIMEEMRGPAGRVIVVDTSLPLLASLARPDTRPAGRSSNLFEGNKNRPVWLTGAVRASGRSQSAYFSLRALLSNSEQACATSLFGFAPPGKVVHPVFIR